MGFGGTGAGMSARDDSAPDLDAWRAEAGACAPLDAAATRGPWLTIEEAPSWDTPNAVGYDSREHHRGPPYYATGVRCGSIEQAESDGRFIAAARTGWPRDAARVGVLADRCAALETRVATLSAIDPAAIRRECARAARNAIFDFGIGNKTSNYYSPIIRKELAVQLVERAILGAELAQDERPRWSPTDIGMLAAMMTGDIDKDWATLTAYLSDEPAQDDGKPILPMFPLQNGNEGDWIIDFDFLMAIQKEYRDADDYGKPSLEEIEETLLVLMRSAEVKRRLEEAKE